MTRYSLTIVALCFICSAACAQIPPDNCLYLPPTLADRVVFYDGFELPDAQPEINRIDAKVSGTVRLTTDGFAGAGCLSSDPKRGQKPFAVRSSHLAGDRPLTVMRWWRVDAKMRDTSSFQLLGLNGKGHINIFVHGAGEWCALKRPTMFVQVDHFPSIANVNWRVMDNSVFQPGEWHHTAITIANASEISYYLDGASLVTVHIKGRLLTADDVTTLQGSGDSGDYAEHPTTTDEMIALDRVLSPLEIQQYYVATSRLRLMHYPPLPTH